MWWQIKRLSFLCGKALFALLALGITYALFALFFGVLSVNNDFKQHPAGSIEIFLVSNGSHASLALPTLLPEQNWFDTFPVANTKDPALAANQKYILIGWGSSTFYTQVPEWKNLRPQTALSALAFDPTVLNVTYIGTPAGPRQQSIMLTSSQYKTLVASIKESIDTSEKPLSVHYQTTDTFYHANGRYTPFRTCNQWTRSRLSDAGVSVPLWAPFAQTLFWHLP